MGGSREAETWPRGSHTCTGSVAELPSNEPRVRGPGTDRKRLPIKQPMLNALLGISVIIAQPEPSVLTPRFCSTKAAFLEQPALLSRRCGVKHLFPLGQMPPHAAASATALIADGYRKRCATSQLEEMIPYMPPA